MSNTAPYNKVFDDLDPAPTNTPTLYELRFPGRGTLRRIIVEMKSPNSDSLSESEGGSGGTFELYSRVVDPDNPDPMYRIYSTTFAGADFNSGELDVQYTNSEGSPTNIVRKLYAVITPGGTGHRIPRIGMMMESPAF